MRTWYEYVCLECGYGGLTDTPEPYRQGRRHCRGCGSTRFEVQEKDLALLAEEEELGPEVEE